MRTLFAIVLGVAASMMASAAFAQARTPPSYNQAAPVPAASQSLAAVLFLSIRPRLPTNLTCCSISGMYQFVCGRLSRHRTMLT